MTKKKRMFADSVAFGVLSIMVAVLAFPIVLGTSAGSSYQGYAPYDLCRISRRYWFCNNRTSSAQSISSSSRSSLRSSSFSSARMSSSVSSYWDDYCVMNPYLCQSSSSSLRSSLRSSSRSSSLSSRASSASSIVWEDICQINPDLCRSSSSSTRASPFSMLDTNGDGVLSVEEIANGIGSVQGIYPGTDSVCSK